MREYISTLKARGDVRIVDAAVDPRFELAAVTQRFQEQHDEALLFRRVQGCNFPVMTNVYGSRRRLCELIGAADGNFCGRWTALTETHGNTQSFIETLDDDGTRKGGKLGQLPLITYFERDGGPYFTSAIFLARDPGSGVHNLSFHRSMYVSDRELRVRLGTTHDLTHYATKAEQMGESLEAVILIGPPPEIFLAACASIPREDDELRVASSIAGRPIPVRRCRSIDLAYPSGTEIAIEGRFLPGVKRPEGPFGEFMGYYVPVQDNAVFEVLDVHWREGAVFHSINCGSPEDMYPLDYAIATMIFRTLTKKLPGILNVACYPHLMNTVVQIRQQYEGHARHVLLAAIAAHLDYSKSCIVVDEDVNIHDLNDVFWAYLTRGRADTRAFILNDMPGFYRDPHKDHWGRLAIDATKPFHRQGEFERKKIPGARELELSRYLST